MEANASHDEPDFLDTFPGLAKSHLAALKSRSTPVTANLTTLHPLPSLPITGLGTSTALTHIQSTILPSLAHAHAGPRYFGFPPQLSSKSTIPTLPLLLLIFVGFVTGGVTSAALVADYLVSTYDQNVAVDLPQSISTHVERHTISMLCDLLDLRGFNGTLTTGATASNILGLACGREWTCSKVTGQSFSDSGEGKCFVFAAGGHSSVGKACSILGIGRNNCLDMSCGMSAADFSMPHMIQNIRIRRTDKIAFIVVATFGEVNTGDFTKAIGDLRNICDEYGGWLHIDAAFGILARIHPHYLQLAEGLELADSIGFDGHKFFNVPYDCGVFLTKHMDTLSAVCGNTGAAYLSASDCELSPLNISLENSRRFRALPLYASLLSLGREGYVDIVTRCCCLAKALGAKIQASSTFILLYPVVYNIVLFQAMRFEPIEANTRVKNAINRTGGLYISGTEWKGQGALRIAICNHLVPANADEEAAEILNILESVL